MNVSAVIWESNASVWSWNHTELKRDQIPDYIYSHEQKQSNDSEYQCFK